MSEYLGDKEMVTFSRSELAPTSELKSNPIVIEAIFHFPGHDKCLVKRLLVDFDASKNVLFYKCFKEMGLASIQLVPSSTKLEDFTTHKVEVKGTIKLEVTLGSSVNIRREWIKFHVVDVDLSYNAILGTPLQAQFDLVVSLPHQRVKFPTETGVGEARSDPRSLLAYLIKVKK